MTISNEKFYLAIDLKSFYASVECVERKLDPLTTNLVVADASRSQKTICLAVSPALKKYGIPGRCRLFELERKIKEINAITGSDIKYIVASPRRALYIKYSANIYGVYLKYFAPEDIHIYSIDEVFIDITSYIPFYKTTPTDLAKTVVKDIFNTTGITATVGVATNLFLAKVAMDIIAKRMKPEKNDLRIAVLDEMSFRKLLWNHRPLTDFWRIGNGIASRLEKNFMYTLGDVARRSLSVQGKASLYKLFGIDAEILIDHAWGVEDCSMKDIKSYKSTSSSVTSGQVLSCGYDFEKARIIIKEMAELLAMELLEKKLVATSFSLFIGYEAFGDNYFFYDKEIVFDIYNRKIPKPAKGTVKLNSATNSISKVREALLYIFDYIVDRDLLVKRINISANNVSFEKVKQLELFTDVQEIKKEESIQQVVLNIHKKYGKNSVLKGFNYQECSTTRERNRQIGGHKA